MTDILKFVVNGVEYSINASACVPAAEAAAEAKVRELIEGGEVIPELAENLATWAEQHSLTVKNKMSETVRTTAGDDPIKTDEGGRVVSIIPKSDFTAKKFFAGCYNLLKHTTLSESFVGGVLTGGYYFLVPKLTFGTFGTAEENNGVLFTGSNQEKLTPTVRFQPLSSGIPSSISDGSACSYHDEEGYRFFTTSGAGWLIVSGIDRSTTCAHIAWEDWYDKYVPVSESETNPEAKVGILALEAFFALIHSDKVLRVINNEVYDYALFGDSSATGYHVCDSASIVAYNGSGSIKWTDTANEVSEGGTPTYTHSANLASMKANGAAKILGGITLEVNGNIVSYSDTNEHAAAATVIYERATIETVTKNYTDSAFSGSNINTSTGKMNINDCSIEALVGASGEAEITMAYAQNIADALAEIARRRMAETEEALEEEEIHAEDLDKEVLSLHAEDPDYKFGQPRELYAHGTPAESRVPDNWRQLADGGYNWTGKPSALGQTYYNVDNQTGSGSIWKAHLKSNYELDWMPAN